VAEVGGQGSGNDEPSKVGKMEQSEAQLQDGAAADSPADGTHAGCQSAEPLLSHIHLGIGFVLDQYFIKNRKQEVKLAALAYDSANLADTCHKVEESSYDNPAESFHDGREMLPPKKIYYAGDLNNGPVTLRAEMTTSTPFLKYRDVGGYHEDSSSNYIDFNTHLGTAMAMHVSRTKTFRVQGSGNFNLDTVVPVSDPAATEKMAFKIHVYVRMNLEGNDGIHRIAYGKIHKEIIDVQKYNQLKLIGDDQFRNDDCTSMPFIPGVQQVHVLIRESGGSFDLEEVYCDGDRIYPE
jgi:hypothetical protein